MNLQQLIKYIESHGQRVLSSTETTITVSATYKTPTGYTMVDETIDATLQAVRDWLGY